MKWLLAGIVIGLLIALGGNVLASRDEPATPAASATRPVEAIAGPLSATESAQLKEIIERVEREYVDDVQHPALIDDALRGLVNGLDPYSSYLDAEE